uniref:Uncharacterized protein n=1 Tax=Trypanosoma congolense (strain IL3000) TaxID=1068625 RepID=G0UUG0_TRYCI|nr:hypothetical protein, unlikely [Trypanosoma congolense IL3000]
MCAIGSRMRVRVLTRMGAATISEGPPWSCVLGLIAGVLVCTLMWSERRRHRGVSTGVFFAYSCATLTSFPSCFLHFTAFVCPFAQHELGLRRRGFSHGAAFVFACRVPSWCAPRLIMWGNFPGAQTRDVMTTTDWSL